MGSSTAGKSFFPTFHQTEGSVDNILLKNSVIMYLVATNHRENMHIKDPIIT